MTSKRMIALIFTASSVALAACSTSQDNAARKETPVITVAATDTSTAVTSSPTAILPAATKQSMQVPTSTPAAVPAKPTASDPTVAASAPAGEETSNSEGETGAELSTNFSGFQSQLFDIQVSFPEGWLVSEEPELGLFIESSEGILDAMPSAQGAAIIVYPRDELAGEDIVEALRQSILNFGPVPSIFIDYPTVSEAGDYQLATAAFNIRETGVEGSYTFIQGANRGAFVFSAYTGLAKSYVLDLLEASIGSITLDSQNKVQ